MKFLIKLAAILFLAAPVYDQQTPPVPDWALPGSPTHKQVPPPPGFHRPTTTYEKPIGIFHSQSDIGTAVVPGSATFDPAARQYTIHSAGYNIWYTRDEFRYLWNKVSGDGLLTLAADITFPDPNGYGDRKGVLVIRQDLDDDAKEIMVAQHGAGLIHIAWRRDKNASLHDMGFRVSASDRPGAANPDISAPLLTKRIGIQKRGDAVVLLVSLDGEPLHQWGPPINIHFEGPYYVGIGFCSHLPDKSDSAIFSNIEISNQIY